MIENHEIEFLPDGGVVSAGGFQAGAARAGIKTTGDDIALVVAAQPATVAAVFTRNAFKAAPVLVCAEHVRGGFARAIITNSGNANCCTGAQGMAAARRTCDLVAVKLDCRPDEVLVCSTGIIGHQLPIEKIEAALPGLELAEGDSVNEKLARAVMTTDTVPKFCAARARFGAAWVTIGGQVKGVGMIGPDMGPMAGPSHATLLAYLTTDAEVPRDLLQLELERAIERSFNSVTIDGDTSTNDTALLLASGASGVTIGPDNQALFAALLDAVCVPLAKMVAADGEGATKLVTVEVHGAASEAEAKRAAMTVANSPLVKTAIFGRDPNWGLIAAAIGRAGVEVEPSRVVIGLNGLEVFHNGELAPFSPEAAEAAMAGSQLTIRAELGVGTASWTAWTCDFSYDYVKINAEYHT